MRHKELLQPSASEIERWCTRVGVGRIPKGGSMTDNTDPGQCMSCQSPATEDSDYCIRCLVKLGGARDGVAPDVDSTDTFPATCR